VRVLRPVARIDAVEHVSADIARQRLHNTTVVHPEAFGSHPNAATGVGRESSGSDQAAAKTNPVNSVDVGQSDIAHQPCFVLRPDKRPFANWSAHHETAGRVEVQEARRVRRAREVPVRVVLARRPSHAPVIPASADQHSVPLRCNNRSAVILRASRCNRSNTARPGLVRSAVAHGERALRRNRGNSERIVER